MKNFEEKLAITLGGWLSSVKFFYICVVLDFIELPPIIHAHDVVAWCTYVSQTVIQLLALPILGAQQRIMTDHHESHAEKLDGLHKKLDHMIRINNS